MKKITFFNCFRLLNPTKSKNNCTFLFLFVLFLGQFVTGQTVLINPTAEGGFENGTTFVDNGWTTVNAATNTWNLGATPAWFSGDRGAYVSNDSGTSWAYTNNIANRSFFYRDVTFPANTNAVTLSFDWRANGNDGNYDNLLVYVVDTSITPMISGPTGTNTTNTTWTGYTNGTTGYYLLQRNGTSTPTSTTNVTYSFTTAQSTYVSGSTKRLVFVWKNDGSGGTNPPASVDNISLVAYTCTGPTALVTSAFSSTTATVGWTAAVPAPASGYDYEVRTSGAVGSGATGLFTSGTTTGVSLPLTGLTANTTYTYYVRSNCGSNDFGSWSSGSFYTGYCVPSSTSTATYINNFSTTGGSTNISNLASGYTTGGYQNNFNTTAVSQYATGTVNFASDIVGGSVGTAIWVDWNNDLIFDNATERVFVTTAFGFNQTGSFVVPNGTALGDYRMRIRIDYNSITPDACSNANARTEAEDYKLTVIPQPACLAPSGVTAAANTAFTATLNWTASLSNPSDGYQYYYATNNTAPTAGTTPSGSVVAGVLTATLSSLTPSTTYFVWVRGNCGSGITSDWTLTPVSFATPCNPPSITGTTPGAVCGQGTVNLSATASEGNIKWYAAQTGGNALVTGANYTTPTINTTTSYWVEASVAGSTQTSGKSAPAAAATTSTTNNWGIVFNATAPVELQSVSVYSTSAGTINIKVTNAALTELYATGDIAVVAGGTTTPNIIPLNFTVPAGTGYRILVKAYSGVNLIRDNSGVTFPYNGTDGGLNITASEWGGTTTANYYYFYDVKYKSPCVSARTEVVASVTTPPALALSTNSTAAVCSGQSTSAVTIVTGATDYDSYVWSPATNVTGDAVNGWVFNPSTTTAYTLTASQSSGSLCQTTTNLTVNINSNPTVNASATNETICEGYSTTLTAVTETTAPGNVTIGTATTLTSATNQPTAFCNRWAQYWNQTIFTAAELQAAGLKPGNINSITYNITTLGDGANVTNFSVRIGNTTNTTLATFVTTGLTTVYGPATYTHAIGANTITFTTPYLWDGVSNIIVDIRQNGADSINNAITYYTATTANMTLSAITSTTFATNPIQNMVSAGTVTPTTSLQRLNVVLGGQVGSIGAGGLDWTWNPGALTGNTVLVAPATSTTYTVRGTNPATGCYAETNIGITVNLAPIPSGDAVQVFEVSDAADATVADLVATGTDVAWYASEDDAIDDINPLALSTQLVSGATYYAVNTSAEGCRSLPFAVTVTVTLGNASFDLAGLKLYPNPTSNLLNVEYTATITSIEVYNLVGQKITAKNVNAISTTVDMSPLAGGTYFVKVQAENASRTIKVIKN
ncbi:T9SS type A sorting domain-containing protein [Flavobacterium sp. J49]|uniref:beta strand repeat-containing protein n=1 Tax=Flavobacterium sp. J49 TaxID=2718534 RepID=UPI00159359B9|nr:GEVED domain-containing protein [Flavobacterium sp. J49]MBF6640390.1 T9SS type A sorting domain-containing protein [Flavobacterium sp. J49]NIC01637.1 T9SS type A sorting domain-containing protein [Flavobacterium sp. J49]